MLTLFGQANKVRRLAGRNPPVLLSVLKKTMQQIDDLLHPVYRKPFKTANFSYPKKKGALPLQSRGKFNVLILKPAGFVNKLRPPATVTLPFSYPL